MDLSLAEETKRVLKDMYGRQLTDAEFQAFLLIAQKLNLDPVSREIIPQVRSGQSGRQISFIISRDGYLRIAMRDPDFGGIQSMVVREGDHFEVHPSEGRVVHKFGAKRGEILGAWAIAYHRKRPPVIAWADFGEYARANAHSPVWKAYPSAMIQKVAEVAALRRQYNITGVVAAEEIGTEEVVVGYSPGEGPGEAPSLPGPGEGEAGGITPTQVNAIGEAVRALGLEAPTARELASRLTEREVRGVKDLSQEEAREFLSYLEDLQAALFDLSPEERGRRLSAWLAATPRSLPGPEDLARGEN
ncbi:MAG: RecT family recombinase [Thermus sp.]